MMDGDGVVVLSYSINYISHFIWNETTWSRVNQTFFSFRLSRLQLLVLTVRCRKKEMHDVQYWPDRDIQQKHISEQSSAHLRVCWGPGNVGVKENFHRRHETAKLNLMRTSRTTSDMSICQYYCSNNLLVTLLSAASELPTARLYKAQLWIHMSNVFVIRIFTRFAANLEILFSVNLSRHPRN